MFKDTDQELARLEAELLREDTQEASFQEADAYDDAYDEPEDAPLPEDAYSDTRPARGPVVYQNYSNQYGKNLRNYASGYRAYNSDVSDEDLEELSEEVYEAQPESRSTGLLITACILAAILAGVTLYIFFRYRGVI